MAKLEDRVQLALYENRDLVLGAQILFGFLYYSAFEKGFERLPLHSRYLSAAALGFMIVGLALLIVPLTYHRIADQGEETDNPHRFATRITNWAIPPLALALGVDLYLVTVKIVAHTGGVTFFGLASTAAALFFWYGLGFVHRRRGRSEPETRWKWEMKDGEGEFGTLLKDKINYVLAESRVMLPGTITLLGVQFVIILGGGFERLTTQSKYVHLASSTLIIVSIRLLLSPVISHHVAGENKDSERFYHFANRRVVAAIMSLALGVSGDLFVVVRKIAASFSAATQATALALLLFSGLWSGFAFYYRNQHEHSRKEAER